MILLFLRKDRSSLPEQSLVFLDLDYLCIVNTHKITFIPVKSSKKHPLTEEDKNFNRDTCNTY